MLFVSKLDGYAGTKVFSISTEKLFLLKRLTIPSIREGFVRVASAGIMPYKNVINKNSMKLILHFSFCKQICFAS